VAIEEHLAILKQGVEAWNAWRQEHESISPDLSNADLSKAALSGADFTNSNLNHIDLSNTSMNGANFTSVDCQYANLRCSKLADAVLEKAAFRGTDLTHAELTNALLKKVKINDATAWYADFSGADLRGAYLFGTDFREAKFCCADLSGANIMHANLNGADFTDAKLDACKIYGTSVWALGGVSDVESQYSLQYGNPQRSKDAALRTDNIEAAQILALLLNQPRIGPLLDSISAKCVLLLSRFGTTRPGKSSQVRIPKRLERIRSRLHEIGYVPLLFDFEQPSTHDLIETVLTLAGMSAFIVADITDPKSVPLELQVVAPNYMVPIVPILKAGNDEFAVLEPLRRKFHWILPTHIYKNDNELLDGLTDNVVSRAEKKRQQLIALRGGQFR